MDRALRSVIAKVRVLFQVRPFISCLGFPFYCEDHVYGNVTETWPFVSDAETWWKKAVSIENFFAGRECDGHRRLYISVEYKYRRVISFCVGWRHEVWDRETIFPKLVSYDFLLHEYFVYLSRPPLRPLCGGTVRDIIDEMENDWNRSEPHLCCRSLVHLVVISLYGLVACCVLSSARKVSLQLKN